MKIIYSHKEKKLVKAIKNERVISYKTADGKQSIARIRWDGYSSSYRYANIIEEDKCSKITFNNLREALDYFGYCKNIRVLTPSEFKKSLLRFWKNYGVGKLLIVKTDHGTASKMYVKSAREDWIDCILVESDGTVIEDSRCSDIVFDFEYKLISTEELYITQWLKDRAKENPNG